MAAPINRQGTGDNNFAPYKEIVYPFDKFEIKVKLSPSNEFIGVTEVKINQKFLSEQQRISSQGSFSVDDFYK